MSGSLCLFSKIPTHQRQGALIQNEENNDTETEDLADSTTDNTTLSNEKGFFYIGCSI